MGKSTAILFILLAFGPHKGEPDSRTAEQSPPAAEEQVGRSSVPIKAELQIPKESPSADYAPAGPQANSPPTRIKAQKPEPDQGSADLEESPSVAKALRNDHGR